tara:strand:- start:734 stop:1183 length:450 start_codon:yes stop_codon:yes gene_type:complete
MFHNITLPVIKTDLCVGYTKDKNTDTDTPIRFRDLVNMRTYISPTTFNIQKEHKSITRIGASIHDCKIRPNGTWQELGAIIYSSEIDKILISYFDKNIWENAKTHFPEEEKWQIFGYYMTDYARKCLGKTLWNNNCLYYWSNVALTIKC